jgi:hypothetical protein
VVGISAALGCGAVAVGATGSSSSDECGFGTGAWRVVGVVVGCGAGVGAGVAVGVGVVAGPVGSGLASGSGAPVVGVVEAQSASLAPVLSEAPGVGEGVGDGVGDGVGVVTGSAGEVDVAGGGQVGVSALGFANPSRHKEAIAHTTPARRGCPRRGKVRPSRLFARVCDIGEPATAPVTAGFRKPDVFSSLSPPEGAHKVAGGVLSKPEDYSSKQV